jgi:capsular polysaccharide biosynthesis protein
MTNSKHPNGYLPKIAYHMADNNHDAVAHFTERQIARYGNLSAEDMMWITRKVASIKRIWAAEEQEFNSHLSVNRF